jgi:hypothetical protein
VTFLCNWSFYRKNITAFVVAFMLLSYHVFMSIDLLFILDYLDWTVILDLPIGIGITISVSSLVVIPFWIYLTGTIRGSWFQLKSVVNNFIINSM